MARSFAAVAIILALSAMTQRQQHHFVLLPTGSLPAAHIP
jgi:hypothetical protein